MQRDLLRNLVLVLFLLASFSANGQYKVLYTPDSLTLDQIGLFSAQEVIYTGIPGREIAITGFITGQDTTGYSVQSAFLLQTNSDGVPQMFSHYYDTTALFYPGARGYGLCYDGMGHFYLAVGTNDNCVIIKTDTLGNMIWTSDGGHHDYYGVIYDNGTIGALGQNESFTGAHDYSIAQIDESGASSIPDMMYGTTGFDVPRAFAKTPTGYVAVGFSANGPFRGNMMVKTNSDLDVDWSRVWRVNDKRVSGEDVIVLPYHGGYYVTGQLESTIGGLDSIYVMRMDTGGNSLWMKSFGLETYSLLFANSIDYVPGTGNVLVGGYYKVGSFSKGFVMSLDSAGNFEWARDYADPDTSIEESINDIVVAPNGEYFFATGNYVFFDGISLTNKIVGWKGPVSNGDIDCDTSLTFGSREVFPFDADVVFTEPYSDNDPYPIIPVLGGTMDDTVICFTMVSTVDALPEKDRLYVVNPVGMEMVVEYEMDLEPGILELRNLQGQLLLTRNVDPGSHRLRIPTTNIPGGLYFLTLRSRTNVYATKKLLFR